MRVSRRQFIKLSAAVGAAFCINPRSVSGAESRPSPAPAGLRLVPAYQAVDLILQAAVLPLAGPPGRAHDPDGAFTVPHVFGVGGLFGAGAGLADLWRAGTLWPAAARLVIGAALLRRGYSPNDPHLGHLAQVAADLLSQPLCFSDDPIGEVRAGRAARALAVAPWAGPPEPDFVCLPEGTLLIEYDWVLLRTAPDPRAARAWLARRSPARPPDDWPVRLIPLMPVSVAARAAQARLWQRVRAAG